VNLRGQIGRLSGGQKALVAAIAVVVAGTGTFTGLALTSGSSKAEPIAAAPPPTTTTPAATTTHPTPTPKPKPKPKPKPAPPVNPLTGIGRPLPGPVIAVKIDDVAAARPQVGIDKADIVYIEQVEAGLTRLIAVYDTNKLVVGPVRSVRASDVELLDQYGRIALAAAGGAGDSLTTLAASPLKGVLGGPWFFRDDSRYMPHNLMLNLAQMSGIGSAAAKSIGWTWAASLAGISGGKPGGSLHTIVGGTAVAFQWNASLKRYVRYIDGVAQVAADGAPVATPNVIVQFCQGYVNPNDIDVVGNPGHYTKTIGTGHVAIYRNGVRIDGTWSRPTAASGTTYRDAKGHVIPLSPGGAWVVLATNGAPLTS
jgi:Protein of unknown function (DUF3048) N-terminal domain/Protein of unknown function (DUF3048) C-terminal domain